MGKHAKQFYMNVKSTNYFKLCVALILAFCFTIPAYSESVSVEAISQQKKTIKGKVTDLKGEPLPGATVQVKGTIKAVSTDIDGNFEIAGLEGNETLVITLIGMRMTEVKLTDQTSLDIVLYEDAINLEGVTAYGYATMKRKDVTGSVVTIGSDKIMRIPANDITASLVGVPGVRMESGGIRIRGNRSIKASNEPLVILDGMAYYQGLVTIDPTDVESIDVLKDASSTSLYGSRGANGVIIITTKKGKEGKTTINYDGFIGTNAVNYNTYHAMNAEEYVAFKREAARAGGTWNSEADDYRIFMGDEFANIGKVDADWVGEYLDKKTLWTSHTLTIASGSPKTQYKIALNYRYDKSRFKGAFNHKYYLTSNIDHQVIKKVKVGTAIRLYYNKNKNKPDPMGSLIHTSPLIPIYNEDGSYNENMGDPSRKNPFLTSNDDYYNDETENWRILVKVYGTYDILDGLTFNTNFSYNQAFSTRGYYYDNRYPGYNDSKNVAGMANNRGTNWVWNNVLNYKKKFGDHGIDAFAVYEVQENRDINTGASGKDQTLPAYLWYNMGALMDSKVISSSFVRRQMLSYLGRIQYTFKDRYLLNVTLREDGASQLSPKNRWSLFPAVSGAWRITEEPFMKTIPVISDLKLHASYGVTGNQSIEPYATLGKLNESFLTFNTDKGEVHYVGMEPGIRPTPDLKWEKTTMLDIGLDFAFLKNRISGTFGYYDSKTKDLLMQKQLPYTSGFNVAWENIGRTRNRGYEAFLSVVPIEQRDLRWTFSMGYYRNKEELVELYDSRLDRDLQNNWWVGYPISGVRYDYKQVGIWQLGEEKLAALYNQKPGDVKVKDLNADGKIDGDDRMIIGVGKPKWTGSIQSTLTWKDFDFAFDCYGEFGAITYDSQATSTWASQLGNINTVKVDYWTPENPNNRHPRPVLGQEVKYLSATGYYDNDYFEIRNITLGYSLNRKLLGERLNKVRFYASVNNPWRYWKYRADGGITYSTTTYVFGVNVQF